MNNRSKVSVDFVINELNLKDMPRIQALKVVIDYIDHSGLQMYFDSEVIGTDAKERYEIIYNDQGEVEAALIANGYSDLHGGEKQATEVYCTGEGDYRFGIYAYQHQGLKYYPTEETGMFLEPLHLPLDWVYFKQDEINQFKKELLKTDAIFSTSLSPPPSEPGIRKALALLARDMADTHPSQFRSGTHVNAKAIKDHILKLARDHEISDRGLKKIDDKLNATLNELDLKDLPKK